MSDHWWKRFGVQPNPLERISLNMEALVGMLNVLDARLEDGKVDEARLQIKRMILQLRGLPCEDLKE
jgi:hypothetical protein|tara:strand:- start:10995 stop:11195 length:201 start_codon:yes stop_codon:yes gene_type:complete